MTKKSEDKGQKRDDRCTLDSSGRLNSGKCRAQSPNHVKLNANRHFSIYYFFPLLPVKKIKAKSYFSQP